MNTLCAAGTGSFLDQQASRLGLTIEEFATRPQSTNPPRIAGRCSVFAKSDMIHLQQIATPDYDIVAGLCNALARNFKSNIGKGKIFVKPISFQGGVAANVGMRKAFLDVLELSDGELIVPKHFASMGAIGAILVAQEDKGSKKEWSGLDHLNQYLRDHKEEQTSLTRLSLSPAHLVLPPPRPSPFNGEGDNIEKLSREKVEAYLGLDVGSISTNLVVVDREKKVLSKRYLMTAGRPIEAVRIGLREIGEEIGDRVEIKGVGTTGSGRYLTADFVGARYGEAMDAFCALEAILEEEEPTPEEIANSLLIHALKLDRERPTDDTSIIVIQISSHPGDLILRMTVRLPLVRS